jgi:hypothetical protein
MNGARRRQELGEQLTKTMDERVGYTKLHWFLLKIILHPCLAAFYCYKYMTDQRRSITKYMNPHRFVVPRLKVIIDAVLLWDDDIGDKPPRSHQGVVSRVVRAGAKEFEAEVRVMTKLRHRNITSSSLSAAGATDPADTSCSSTSLCPIMVASTSISTILREYERTARTR